MLLRATQEIGMKVILCSLRVLADTALDKANLVSQKSDNDGDNAMMSGHLTIRGGAKEGAGRTSIAHHVNRQQF